MNAAERLEALGQVLDLLRQAAAGAAVVVEGRRDDEALETLGVGGTHLKIHTGAPLEARIDAIAEQAQAEQWPRVIILTDWDRTGGRLAARLQQGLAARVSLDMEFRRRLSRVSHASCVEHVPADLAGLRAQVGRTD